MASLPQMEIILKRWFNSNGRENRGGIMFDRFFTESKYRISYSFHFTMDKVSLDIRALKLNLHFSIEVFKRDCGHTR